ncbi:MAG TPA: HAD family phosphatase [Propionicimonas sp.]|nr:HAD family phosphatase [Propionicimonas sp.]
MPDIVGNDLARQLSATWRPVNDPVRAVAFDCDGLLVDTEVCWTRAEAVMFAHHGLEFTTELKAQLIGTTMDFTVARMAQLFDTVGAEAALKAELAETVAEVIAADAVPMAGAVEIVAALTGRLPLAVVSNSPRVLVELALSRAGLSDAFGVWVTAEDVVHGKPAPDLYLRACERLAVAPTEVLAFEDTVVGVNSAKAAGLTVVGIPTVEQDAFAPHHRFDSLAHDSLVSWSRFAAV